MTLVVTVEPFCYDSCCVRSGPLTKQWTLEGTGQSRQGPWTRCRASTDACSGDRPSAVCGSLLNRRLGALPCPGSAASVWALPLFLRNRMVRTGTRLVTGLSRGRGLQRQARNIAGKRAGLCGTDRGSLEEETHDCPVPRPAAC